MSPLLAAAPRASAARSAAPVAKAKAEAAWPEGKELERGIWTWRLASSSASCPRRASPGAQRLGDEVGKAGGDAERNEALPSRKPATGPAKEGQRGRDSEPELAVVGGAGKTAHGDVQRGGLAGGDRSIEGGIDCLRLIEPLAHRGDGLERFGVPRTAIRASARTVSQAPSGIAADGEAPGCAAAIRTRSAAGRMLKRSGASRVTASPSMPAAIGPSASTSNAGADHSRQGRWKSRRPPRRRGSDGDPQQPVVDPRPGARADRTPEAVAIVGDEDRRAGGVLMPSGPVPAQVQPLALRSQRLGQRVEDGPQLRLPIALALDGLGVEAESRRC